MIAGMIALAWFCLFSWILLLFAARSLTWILVYQVSRWFSDTEDHTSRGIANVVAHSLTMAGLLLGFTGQLRWLMDPMNQFFTHTASALSHGV